MTISKRNASKRRKSKQIDEGKVAPKAEEAKATLAPPPKGSKLKKLATRCISATIMFLAFTAIVYTGHLTVAGTMILLQVFTFRELVNLRYIEAKEKNMPYFRTLQWLWFYAAIFGAHGSTWLKAPMGIDKHIYLNYIQRYLLTNSLILNEVAFFDFLSFGLFSLCFVLSVLSLKQGMYDYQITQFTWTLMCVVILVLQMKTLVFNIYNGLFWFIFPFLCVAVNDSGAYFAGISLGGKIFTRRVADNVYKPITFLKLSPKKTWEGFSGALIFTVMFGYYAAPIIGQFRHFACSYEELRLNAEICSNDILFRDQIKYHGVSIALFASLVAPFGGFWASALKRACNIKDFNNLIPGHGGFMDRLDCQFIMVSFVYLYHATFLGHPTLPTISSVDQMYQMATLRLSEKDQCLLAAKLVGSSDPSSCGSIINIRP